MPAFNKVKVIWTAQEYGRLKLVEVTAGGCEDSTFYEVTIQPTPTADISGDQEVREGEIHEYITEATSSDITKKWYAVNGEIIGDDDADTLRVKWPKGGLGAVIQTQKTEAECADSNIITVRIFEEIGISGTRNVCQDATELYEANKNLGAYAEWTVVGGEIQGSSNGRTCLVKWGTPGIGILRLIQWIPNTTYRDTIDINVNINGKPAKPSITENQDTLISSADAGNQWYWNGQLIPGATSKKYYTYQVKGNYTVQVTVAHKCISLMSDMYSFTSDIEDNTELDVIKVFPNPSAGEYQIIINNLVGEFEYRVVNLLGLEIAEGRGVAGNETLKVNLEGEAAGIYHLIITINGRQYLEKLILTR